MIQSLNQRIAHIPIPERMRSLPISAEGYPTPWFVGTDPATGLRDFRTMDGEKLGIAVRLRRCWLCGQPLGKFMTFVIGPMCAVNRASAEPPCHRDCARYAVEACPFLSQPRMRRNTVEMPEHDGVAGLMIERNPGCALLWTTESYKLFKAGGGGSGIMFKIGDPVEVEYWAQGRKAKREEILQSMESGLPILQQAAEDDGAEAVAELAQCYAKALELVPQ